jgi:hypothetical protein
MVEVVDKLVKVLVPVVRDAQLTWLMVVLLVMAGILAEVARLVVVVSEERVDRLLASWLVV